MEPIKLNRGFVLDSIPMRNGVFEVWIPGGQSRMISLPKDGMVDKLPPVIPWNRRVAIAYGYNIPSTTLKVMAYDIETLVPGASPNPDRDTLKSIAWWADNQLWCMDCRDDAERVQAIEMFIAAVQGYDPDVLADYFGKRYDMIVLLNESRRLDIHFGLGRDGSEPEVISGKQKGRWGIKSIEIRGRVHFDVFEEACFDQSLNGVRKGLKPVSQHLGIKNIIIEDTSAIDRLAAEARMNYNVSDARLTYILGTMYLESLTALADKLSIPLKLAVSRTPTHIGDYFYGREHLDRGGGKSYGNNQERNPEVFKKKGVKYQGGFVEMIREGLFKPAHKLDFNSLYPAIMAMLNADPKTIEVVKIERWVDLPPRFSRAAADTGRIEFSDDKIGRVTLDIYLGEDSTTRTEMLNLLSWKNELKPQSKFNAKARSNYWVVKLLLNATYGYHGSPWANWGSIWVAVLACAIGRYVVKELRDRMENPIGVDTDGVVGAGKVPNFSGIEAAIQGLIPDYYQTNLLQLDADPIEVMLSVDEKNYVTQEKGKIMVHGSGLKGRHVPYAVSDGLEIGLREVFAGNNPISALRDYVLKFPTMNPRQFQISSDFGKNPSDYESNHVMKQLADQLKAANVEVAINDSVYYVKTVDGYAPTVLAGDRNLDFKYYRLALAKKLSKALWPVLGLTERQMMKELMI